MSSVSWHSEQKQQERNFECSHPKTYFYITNTNVYTSNPAYPSIPIFISHPIHVYGVQCEEGKGWQWDLILHTATNRLEGRHSIAPREVCCGLASSMLVCGGCLCCYLRMLVGGRTMHARECQGMLVGAGDLLRQIAATKGIKRNTRSCSWQNYQKVGFKVYNKKE